MTEHVFYVPEPLPEPPAWEEQEWCDFGFSCQHKGCLVWCDDCIEFDHPDLSWAR